MQKAAYEMRISDWSSDVCSSDLVDLLDGQVGNPAVATDPQHQVDRALAAHALGLRRVLRRIQAVARQVVGRPVATLAEVGAADRDFETVLSHGPGEDRKSTRLNSSH